MIIYRKIAALKANLEILRETVKLGFVPTMGALHDGHLQLLRKAREENAFTILSIFVNPVQFNDPGDFKKYPVTLEEDIEKLLREGCDILFLPHQDEMYPQGLKPVESLDLGLLDTVLEGSSRPGHFQGVCRVVDLLLSIVEPAQLYMGQKDYQQCMVISRLLKITGRSTQLVICDTEREWDGLAMSSRNMRLTEEQRKIAPEIYQLLQYFEKNLTSGNLSYMKDYGYATLNEKGFRVDYIAFVNAESLKNISSWDGKEAVVALIAAFIDDIRLIDNKVLAS